MTLFTGHYKLWLFLSQNCDFIVGPESENTETSWGVTFFQFHLRVVGDKEDLMQSALYTDESWNEKVNKPLV